jgi:CRISPR-associated protein Cmr4
MYQQAHGIIKTLAPLHVGASAGEEAGNLNLIFRDQFTKTGIVPGSSIRGRMRAEMRLKHLQWLEKTFEERDIEIPTNPTIDLDPKSDDLSKKSKPVTKLQWLKNKAAELKILSPAEINEDLWYGREAITGDPNSTTESLVKFEYASILWLPVFCPGQPIVWVSCPRLLQRYQRLAGIKAPEIKVYSSSRQLKPSKLFFNFGFLTIENPKEDLTSWFPDQQERPAVIVANDDIEMIHEMALYRQTRIAMESEQKLVANFFGVEALPEETILIFPIAHRADGHGHSWNPSTEQTDIYIGGMESIGFGHCELTLKGL